MAEEKKDVSKTDAANSDAAVKPDPGTTNTTDPQEHMEGPLSSLMKGASETFKKEGGKSEDSEK